MNNENLRILYWTRNSQKKFMYSKNFINFFFQVRSIFFLDFFHWSRVTTFFFITNYLFVDNLEKKVCFFQVLDFVRKFFFPMTTKTFSLSFNWSKWKKIWNIWVYTSPIFLWQPLCSLHLKTARYRSFEAMSFLSKKSIWNFWIDSHIRIQSRILHKFLFNQAKKNFI